MTDTQAARESNSAAIAAMVASIIAGYQATVVATEEARTAVLTAEEAQRTKLENTYVRLAELAHKHDLEPVMCRDLLTNALGAYYDKKDFDVAVSTASKLRSQLLRAMQKKVRGSLSTIVKPWVDAWEAEGAAKAADDTAATPLRDKFDNRGNTVTQAIKLALGKEPNAKGKGGQASVVAAKPEDVLTWVSAHPRQKRGATMTSGDAPAATGSPREQARARVAAIIDSVKALANDYPVALDTIQPVLDALAKCTGDRLVQSNGDKAAPAAAPAAAEPEQGVVNIDDLLRRELEIIQKLTRAAR